MFNNLVAVEVKENDCSAILIEWEFSVAATKSVADGAADHRMGFIFCSVLG